MTTNKVYTTDNRNEIIAIPCPAPTHSWKPISHGELVTTLERAVHAQGIDIRSERYTIARDGLRMFGAWVLDVGDGSKWMLGFRQGLDKSMAIGLTAGSYVTVCSNMMFSGDFVEFRMHTSGLDSDNLWMLAQRGVSSMTDRMARLADWQEGLKRRMLSSSQFKALTFDLIDKGAIVPSQWDAFQTSLVEESAIYGKHQTLHLAHAAGTRTMRGLPVGTMQRRSAILGNVIDMYA